MFFSSSYCSKATWLDHKTTKLEICRYWDFHDMTWQSDQKIMSVQITNSNVTFRINASYKVFKRMTFNKLEPQWIPEQISSVFIPAKHSMGRGDLKMEKVCHLLLDKTNVSKSHMNVFGEQFLWSFMKWSDEKSHGFNKCITYNNTSLLSKLCLVY